MSAGEPIVLPNKSPFRDHLDMTFVSIEDGRSVCHMTLQDKHRNSRGALHGGAAFTMTDSGMTHALHTVLTEDEWALTMEINISYLNAVTAGTLVCESQVLRRGKHVGFVEAEIRLKDTLVAKASGTMGIMTR